MRCAIESVRWRSNDDVAPASLAIPDGFFVRVGEGWSGSLHGLADAMEAFGPGAAAGVPL